MTHSEPDVNLGKLVPLEVHSILENAKITKKHFPKLTWGMPYNIGKIIGRTFHKLKITLFRAALKEIRPREIPRLKVGNSKECPGVTLDPKGGPAKGCRSICIEGGVTHSGSPVVNFLPGVCERTTNPNEEP